MKLKVTAKQIQGDEGLAVTLVGVEQNPENGVVCRQLTLEARGKAMKELQGFEPHQIVDVPLKAPST